MPGYGGSSTTKEEEKFKDMNLLSYIGNKQNLIILLLLAILSLLIYKSFISCKK